MARNKRSPDKYLTGEEVKAWRVSRRLTQPDLGRWLGLTPQAVARYEVVGASKATALAFAAIDRGLQPLKVTAADHRAARLRAKPTREEDNDGTDS